MLVNLIKSGSIDCVHLNRNQLLQNIDVLISFCDLFKRENNSDQNTLFAQEEQNLKVKLNSHIINCKIILLLLKQRFIINQM